MQPYLIRLLEQTKTSLQEAVTHVNELVVNDFCYDEVDVEEITLLLRDCQRRINRINERLPLVEPRDDVNMLHEKLPKITATNFRDPKDTPRDETPYLGAGGDGSITVHPTGGDPEKDTKISPVKVIFFTIYTIGFIAFWVTVILLLKGWK